MITSFPGRMRISAIIPLLSVVTAVVAAPAPNQSAPATGGPFEDVPADHTFVTPITRLANAGITKGCGDGEFCPDAAVTRGQMAAFLARALKLSTGHTTFEDTRRHLFEKDIAALAHAGITTGCGDDEYCPDEPVTRGQSAAFLTRALSLPTGHTIFDDTRGHLFEKDIAALADAGITVGCGDGDYCPDEPLTRAQMAAFLSRSGVVEAARANGDNHKPAEQRRHDPTGRAGKDVTEPLTAAFSLSPSTSLVGETVTLDASASSGDIVSYQWDGASGDLGQWPLGEGEVIDVAFEQDGTKRPRLTITDADGNTDSHVIEHEVMATTDSTADVGDTAQQDDAAIARDTTPVDVTVHVDGRTGNNANDGTASRPVKTINRGIDLADRANRRGDSVRVLVNEGTYREFVVLSQNAQTTDAPVVIEGRGDVVISGSQVFSGWTRGGDGTWSVGWQHNWGLWDIPDMWTRNGFDEQLRAFPVTRRREMVFVNGQTLRQVTDRAALTRGDFHVDEANDRLTISPPSGIDPRNATIEVAVRPEALLVNRRANVTLHNLTVQHAANDRQQASAAIAHSRNVTVRDSSFVHNNWKGLGIFNSQDLLLERIVASRNGIAGFTAASVTDLRLIDSVTSYNNWRGARGRDQFRVSFSSVDGGQKFLNTTRVTVRNHTAQHNQSAGLWFDWSNKDATVDNATLTDNADWGLFIEASPGPFNITDSRICRNDKGLRIANATAGTVAGNVLADNAFAQIWVTGIPERNDVTTRDWIVRDNRIASGQGQFAYATRGDAVVWTVFEDTLSGDRNTFTHQGEASILRVERGTKLNFDQWQARSGVDRTSTDSRAAPRC